MHWPDKIPFTPDAREHAMTILEEFGGDWKMASAICPLYAPTFGEDYAERLLWLLIPKGEC